ncbi:MAG: low temperature requirement protein A [Proteobacteria bacterium]|nr:low temperature requirement protein A [Pseudomonadota bacterium]
MAATKNHLRRRGSHHDGRVTNVELFFDLVFVFAVTQLSHGLLAHMTALGALQTALLMMGVWWVWIYTSWITNWLDPEQLPVRLMLFVLMGAGLILAASIPEAFGQRGPIFAGAYIFMQVGRSLFMLWALKKHDRGNYRNFLRITSWLALAAIFWIVGGWVDPGHRLGWWIVALAIEYVSPAVGMWTPGLGRSTPADWKIDGGHMAERCALFVIIALGESVLMTGATFAEMEWNAEVLVAFAATFAGSVALWAVYFNIGAERASRLIAGSADPGRLARSGYTYLHILIVAGIIVSAVANEIAMAHPHGHASAGTVLVMLGGPVLYLVGTALFKRLSAPNVPLSHLVGLGLFALLALGAAYATTLQLAVAATAILIVVALWESVSLRGRQAGEPA